MSGRKRDNGGGGHAGEEAWLLPYADMITLLLGLFIVLFALSSVDQAKFDSVSKAFSETFRGGLLENPGDVLSGSSGALSAEATTARTRQALVVNQSAAASRTQARFKREEKELQKLAATVQGDFKGQLNVSEDSRGLVLSIAGDALFASGSYDVKPNAAKQLADIAKHLDQFGAQISIEGHTDGAPFAGPFGNQGLSSDRALAVWDIFRIAGFAQDKMDTMGKGATEPVVRPKNPKDGIAANRRVEIHILAPGAQPAAYKSDKVRKAEKAAAKNPERTLLGSAVATEANRPKPVTAPISSTPATKPSKTDPAAGDDWGGSSTTADIIKPVIDAP